jgi:hypothetical protein
MLPTLVLLNCLYVEMKQSKIDKNQQPNKSSFLGYDHFIYFKTFERAVFAKPAFFAKCASLLCQFDSIFSRIIEYISHKRTSNFAHPLALL